MRYAPIASDIKQAMKIHANPMGMYCNEKPIKYPNGLFVSNGNLVITINKIKCKICLKCLEDFHCEVEK